MKVVNLTNLSETAFDEIGSELMAHKTLRRVLAWAKSKNVKDFHPHIVSEVIVQDEYTHDVIVPFRDLFLVFDTT